MTDAGAKPEDQQRGLLEPAAGTAPGQAAATAGGPGVAGGPDASDVREGPETPRGRGPCRRQRWDSLRSEVLFRLAPPAAALVVVCRRLGAPELARRLQILITWRMGAQSVPHPEVRHLLDAAQGYERLRLAHLLLCRSCRRRARRRLSQEVTEDLDTVMAGDPAGVAGEAAETAARMSVVSRELARRLLKLRHGDPERQEMIERLDRSAPLLAIAAAAIGEPALCAELALRVLALAASGAEGDTADERVSTRLAALGLLLLARNREGRLAEARTVHALALPLLAEAPALHRPRASFLAALGQLRWSEGRLDEAAGLYAQAGWALARLGQKQAGAACQALAGMVLLALDHPLRARAELDQGAADLDAGLAPDLAARVELAHACCCALLDARSQTREILARFARRHVPPLDPGEAAARAWWQGRAWALLGRWQRALALIEGARGHLVAAGSLGEAVRASLDVLRLRVKTAASGPGGHPDGLADDLLAAFPESPDVLNWGGEIASLARLAAKGSPRFPAHLRALQAAADALPPDLVRPDLIAPVQSLADPVLAEPDQKVCDLVIAVAGARGPARSLWAWR